MLFRFIECFIQLYLDCTNRFLKKNVGENNAIDTIIEVQYIFLKLSLFPSFLTAIDIWLSHISR